MVTNSWRWVALALLCSVCRVSAYDEESTHPVLSGAAVRTSDLNNPASGVFDGLGLRGTIHQPRWFALDPMSGFAGRSILGLVTAGSTAEDHDITTESVLSRTRYRVFRHFYDPQNNGRGLTVPAFGALGESSTRWALEADGQVPLQKFSYADAREHLRTTLTGRSEAERDQSMQQMFVSLGHVIHHIQDMAQPQHVRNEDHCQSFGCAALGTYYPSAYERHVADKGRRILVDGYDPADSGTFSVPTEFWEKEGMGMAEFTSRAFVGLRSNLRGTPDDIRPALGYAEPSGVGTTVEKRQITDADLLGPAGPDQPLTGEIWFLAKAVPDRYRNNASGINLRLSSFSVFSSDLRGFNPEFAQAFTLTRFNYDAALAFLLPRAAAYSAGLINYFFRGRIAIGLPEEGVYGVIDHASTYAAGQGFDKLKLKLSNASPDGEKPSGESVRQTMQGGTLVAVAKYTLNGCYQPDLSGDYSGRFDTGEIFPPAGCTFAQYIAGEEQISQSAAQLAVSLDTAPTEFTFDFSSQPIPVNARDLRIQVVYTGTLGSEEDAIAFGGRDISEPTHLVVYNNSDYFAVDGKLYTPAQIRANATLSQRTAGLDIDPRPLATVSLSAVSGRPIAGASGAIPVNGYVRVAVLAERDEPLTVNVLSRFEGGGFSVSSFPGIPTTVIDLRNDDGYITAYGIYRGPRGNFFDAVFKANSDAPVSGEELTVMSGRMAGDPGPTVIPVRF